MAVQLICYEIYSSLLFDGADGYGGRNGVPLKNNLDYILVAVSVELLIKNEPIVKIVRINRPKINT